MLIRIISECSQTDIDVKDEIERKRHIEYVSKNYVKTFLQKCTLLIRNILYVVFVFLQSLLPLKIQ